MFNSLHYENSRGAGIGVLEVRKPAPDQSNGATPAFVPLQRSELRGEIAGPLADLKLTQVFGYSADQCDRVLDAVYRFPLPGDAAIRQVTARFGEVKIVASLRERQEAEAEFAQARSEGKQAILATREAPDVFTLQVSGIRPGQEITVETAYVQLARAEASGWSLRVPLTTAPRYIRIDEVGSGQAGGQPLGVLRDPGHRFLLDVDVHGAGQVTSPTHDLRVDKQTETCHVQLAAGTIVPDRDCVVVWQPVQDAEKPVLQGWAHDDEAEGYVYFLAWVAPPALQPSTGAIPREVTLLVDHSGSMHGPKWDAADWTVKRFLSDLNQSDAFALGVFHSATKWFDRRLQRANDTMVGRAIEWLEHNGDSGGTELGMALEQALDLERLPGVHARNILIITDAEVTDRGRILRLADYEARARNARRISVLCIDAAPNAFLAAELAERGGGVAKFLTSAPDGQDIVTALDEVLADWAEPVLSNLSLGVNRSEVESSGRRVLRSREKGWSFVDLGDLPAGRAVWVVGRAPRADGCNLDLRLQIHEDVGIAATSVSARGFSAIKALFGARRINGLEYLLAAGYQADALAIQLGHLGYDAKSVLTGRATPQQRVYFENIRNDVMRSIRSLLVSEALNYGLASSETGFVASRMENGLRSQETVFVANALPAGWSEEFVSPLRGAATVTPPGAATPQPYSMSMPSAMPMPPQSSLNFRSASPQEMPAIFDSMYFGRGGSQEANGRDETRSQTVLFSGVPAFAGERAVLFDSRFQQDRIPQAVTISGIRVRFTGGVSQPARFDPRLSLVIYVGDLAVPRAKVRLADLMRQGERPLNLLRSSGEIVRFVLEDMSGAFALKPLPIELIVKW